MRHPTMLIVGASGFVGRRLFDHLGPQRAIATYCHHPIAGGVHFDAATMRLADTVLSRPHELTHAFLLLGSTKIDHCALAPEETAKTNVIDVNRMIDDLIAAGVVPVFASSDAVFSGTRGGYGDDDEPDPVLTYGAQKAAVERHLRAQHAPWLVARLSKVIGPDMDTHSLLGEWLRNIEEGERILCAKDQFFSPAGVDDVVRALVTLAEGGHRGVFNVCGPRALSRFDLLTTLVGEVQRYWRVQPQIVPCSIRDFPFAEARPLDTSLAPDKLYSALGWRFQDVVSICQAVAGLRYGKSDKVSAQRVQL